MNSYDEVQKRIENRMRVKDMREDSRSRQINISWSLNCATQMVSTGFPITVKNETGDEETKTGKDALEPYADYFLALFDKKFMERTPKLEEDEVQVEATKKDTKEKSRIDVIEDMQDLNE